MKFKVDWIEEKEYQGRKYCVATITSEQGIKYDVSLGDKWGARLGELTAGEEIEGNTWQNPKNGKWSLYPIEERRTFTKKSSPIEKAVEQKSANIEKAQENRAEGVKISATMRDAVLCAIEEKNPDDLSDNIIKWRKWLWKHWDDPITDATYPD